MPYDPAGPARLMSAAVGASLGLVLGALAGTGTRAEGLVPVLVVLGLVAEAAVLVAWNLRARRVDHRLRDRVVAGAPGIVAGSVAAVPVVARVVRRRVDRQRGWHLAGGGSGPGPSLLLVADAATNGGTRRVAALVPAALGLELRRASVTLLLHPTDDEVAVLDDRVPPAQAVVAPARGGAGPERAGVGGTGPARRATVRTQVLLVLCFGAGLLVVGSVTAGLLARA